MTKRNSMLEGYKSAGDPFKLEKRAGAGDNAELIATILKWGLGLGIGIPAAAGIVAGSAASSLTSPTSTDFKNAQAKIVESGLDQTIAEIERNRQAAEIEQKRNKGKQREIRLV